MNKIKTTALSNNIETNEILALFAHLKKLLEHKSRFYWHGHFFQSYIDNKVVPLGLRIKIFPTLKNLPNLLRTEWEENLTTCSVNMMRMLKDHYDLENKKLDAEIQGIQNKRYPFQETDISILSEEEVKTYVDEYNKLLIQNQDKKCAKGSVAFKMGRAYKWNATNRGNFNGFRQTNDKNASDTSTTSSFRSQTNCTHWGFQPHTHATGPTAPSQENLDTNCTQAPKRKIPPSV